MQRLLEIPDGVVISTVVLVDDADFHRQGELVLIQQLDAFDQRREAVLMILEKVRAAVIIHQAPVAVRHAGRILDRLLILVLSFRGILLDRVVVIAQVHVPVGQIRRRAQDPLEVVARLRALLDITLLLPVFAPADQHAPAIGVKARRLLQ